MTSYCAADVSDTVLVVANVGREACEAFLGGRLVLLRHRELMIEDGWVEPDVQYRLN